MTIERLSAYGHAFQIKVLSALLNDKEFLQGIADALSIDYFESPAHKWIIDFILAYYTKYHTNPSVDVLHVEIKKEKNEILKVSIIEELRQAYSADEEDSEYVKEEFNTFCLNQKLKNALLGSVDLLQNGEYDAIRKIINDALKQNGDRNLGHIYDKDVETRYRDDENMKIEFPWAKLNEVTEGGYGPGNLVLIFAPPGIGKSWWVSCIGAHAMKKGYNVAHYTLELSEAYVGKRYDSILTGIPVNDLKHHREEVESIISQIPGKVIIKEYSPGRASLQTIENHLNRLKNEKGFDPDIVIIDYPDLLKSPRHRNDLKQEIDDIYVAIKGMAVDMKKPFICPSQINRAGSQDDVIEGDKVAGSFNKMMIGDLNCSISRKRKDKAAGTGRFHIMKSRLGPDGITFFMKVNMASGKIEMFDEDYIDGSNSIIDNSNIQKSYIDNKDKKRLSDNFLKITE